MEKLESGDTSQSFNENLVCTNLGIHRNKSTFIKATGDNFITLEDFPYNPDGYGYKDDVLILSESKNKISSGSDGEKYYYIYKKIGKLFNHLEEQNQLKKTKFVVSLFGFFYYVYNNNYNQGVELYKEKKVKNIATKGEILKTLKNLYESYMDVFEYHILNKKYLEFLETKIHLYDYNNNIQEITISDLGSFIELNGVK